MGVIVNVVLDHLLSKVCVGADKSDGDWNLNTDLICGFDNSLRDHIALHNASKNIDENALNFRMSRQNFKCCLDLFSAGAAAHIQKVGWHASFQLNDVHGGHGKTCTVDHATNASIQSDVVETDLGSLLLIGIDIAGGIRLAVRFNNLLLSEVGVSVNVDLGINAVDIKVRGHGPGVNFDLGSVNTQKHLVQLVQLFNTLAVGLSLEAEVGADLVGCLFSQTFVDLEGVSVDS